MLRLILFSFIILTTLLNTGCFNNSDTARIDSSQIIGEVEIYTFSPDPQWDTGRSCRKFLGIEY